VGWCRIYPRNQCTGRTRRLIPPLPPTPTSPGSEPAMYGQGQRGAALSIGPVLKLSGHCLRQLQGNGGHRAAMGPHVWQYERGRRVIHGKHERIHSLRLRTPLSPAPAQAAPIALRLKPATAIGASTARSISASAVYPGLLHAESSSLFFLDSYSQNCRTNSANFPICTRMRKRVCMTWRLINLHRIHKGVR